METKAINEDYWIDRNGIIYSRKRFGAKGGLVKQWLDIHGYFNVRLTINNKTKNYRVHRLYAEAYIKNPKKLPQVNHINGIKTDNRLENLEWCTAQQNIQHAVITGLKKYKSNTGEKYIYWESINKCWRVIISEKNGKKIRLGRFKSLEQAIINRNQYLKTT